MSPCSLSTVSASSAPRSLKQRTVAEAYIGPDPDGPSAHSFGNVKGFSRDGVGETSFFAGGWDDGFTAVGFDLMYDYTIYCPFSSYLLSSPPISYYIHPFPRSEVMPNQCSCPQQFLCTLSPSRPQWDATGRPYASAPRAKRNPSVHRVPAVQGSRSVHWDNLARGGSGVLDGAETDGAAGGCVSERILYVEPRETYEMGKGRIC